MWFDYQWNYIGDDDYDYVDDDGGGDDNDGGCGGGNEDDDDDDDDSHNSKADGVDWLIGGKIRSATA